MDFIKYKNTKVAPLTRDLMFKRIFKKEDTKYLKSLLNTHLPLHIKNDEKLTILDGECIPEVVDGKTSIMDVVAKSNDCLFVLEMQTYDKGNTEDRNYFYMNRVQNRYGLFKGEFYHDLKEVHGLLITTFNITDNDKVVQQVHMQYEDLSNKYFTNKIRVCTMELGKVDKSKKVNEKNVWEDKKRARFTVVQIIHLSLYCLLFFLSFCPKLLLCAVVLLL